MENFENFYKKLSVNNFNWLVYVFITLSIRAKNWIEMPEFRKEIETELGADLFYGSNNKLFKRGISLEAKRLINECGNKTNATRLRLIVNDHEFGRRNAARFLIKLFLKGTLTWKRFLILCVRKLLITNIISKKEHGILSPIQKERLDLSVKEQYKLANIKLCL